MPRPKMPPVETMTPKEIRKLRTDLGLSQTEFGMLIGADGKTVSRWETGNPIRGRAHKLALIRFRDYDQHAADFEDRVRDVRFSLLSTDHA